MATLRYSSTMIFLAAVLSVPSSVCLSGCGSSSYLSTAATGGSNSAPSTSSISLVLNPATAVSTINGSLSFTPVEVNSGSGSTTTLNPSSCDWTSNDDTVLSGGNTGTFVGAAEGSATVTAVCSKMEAEATAAVSAPQNPTAIKITHGGVYTGTWSSNDPNTPAVVIQTDDPVTIKNSTITGRGTLIMVYGNKGANVTVTNTTGTALDPGVSGDAKGKFIDAQVMNSLTVQNCTMQSTSFGVYIVSSSLTSLNIANNVGINLDDRVSDGKGGYLLNQRVLGHFIMLNGDTLPNGGVIAWNQIINATGLSSIEDVISLYQSRGGDATHLISLHDNYIQGAFATGLTTSYTGGGIQFDGSSNSPATANGFVDVANNIIVKTANFGISIGAGHDINVHGNRVVSCGQDGQGNWINFTGYAYGMWNFYNTQQYYNNQITGNTGGAVTVQNGKPVEADFDIPSISQTLNDTVSGNQLDQPCWVNGVLSQAAEATALSAWQAKVASAGMVLGAQ